MSGLDDFDLAGFHGVAIARYDQALERRLPIIFNRAGHGAARFAGADHAGTARRRRRQMGGKTERRLCSIYGSVEHVA